MRDVEAEFVFWIVVLVLVILFCIGLFVGFVASLNQDQGSLATEAHQPELSIPLQVEALPDAPEAQNQNDKEREKLLPLIREAKESVNRSPRDVLFRIRLGHLLFVVGEQSEANEHYRVALSLGIDDPRTAGIVHLLYASSLSIEEDGFSVPSVSYSCPEQFEALEQYRYEPLKDILDILGGWKEALAKHPLSRHHLDESAKSFEVATRIHSGDLHSLRILRDLYSWLGYSKKQGRIESLIVSAETRATLQMPVPLKIAKTTLDQDTTFEHRCTALLTSRGYKVRHTGRTGDGGIDLRAEDLTPLTGSTVIVQCKDQEQPIGEPKIREFYGLIEAEAVHKGIFITTSQFTESARHFAAGKRTELVDGNLLDALENSASH